MPRNPPFSPKTGVGRTSTKPALALHPPTAGRGWPGTRTGIGVKSPQEQPEGDLWGPADRFTNGFFLHLFLASTQIRKKLLWDETP